MPDVIYRVIQLPEALLAAMREFRDRTETTNAKVLATAVENNLPSLVEARNRVWHAFHRKLHKLARVACSETVSSTRPTAPREMMSFA